MKTESKNLFGFKGRNGMKHPVPVQRLHGDIFLFRENNIIYITDCDFRNFKFCKQLTEEDLFSSLHGIGIVTQFSFRNKINNENREVLRRKHER